MSVPDEPDSPDDPDRQPMRDLLLAQALDACIAAERQVPGSSEEIIARQPAWARRDLRRLVGLAGSLDAATSNAFMSDEFRVKARARLMQRIGAGKSADAFAARAPMSAGRTGPVPPASEPAARDATRPGSPHLKAVPLRASASASTLAPAATPRAPLRRRSRWMWRGAAALLAAVLGLVATLTASASALPGEPLYSLKQVKEDLEVRLAADDRARSLTLLRIGDTRLDETAQLLKLGRTEQVAKTTQRYDNVVEQATLTYAVTVYGTLAGTTAAVAPVETKLSQQQDQLEALLQLAPAPVQADLREALVTTERGRALVADQRPSDRGQDQTQVAAAIPTMAAALPALATPPVAEDRPTPAPAIATQAATPAAPTPMAPTAAAPTPAAPTPSAPVAAPRPTDAPTAAPLLAQVTDAGPGADAGTSTGASSALPQPRTDLGQAQFTSNRRGSDTPALPGVTVPDDDQDSGGLEADGRPPRGLDVVMGGGVGQVVFGGAADGGLRTSDAGLRNGDTAFRSGDAGLRNGDARTPALDRLSSNPTVQVTARTLVSTPQVVTAAQAAPTQTVAGAATRRRGDESTAQPVAVSQTLATAVASPTSGKFIAAVVASTALPKAIAPWGLKFPNRSVSNGAAAREGGSGPRSVGVTPAAVAIKPVQTAAAPIQTAANVSRRPTPDPVAKTSVDQKPGSIPVPARHNDGR